MHVSANELQPWALSPDEALSLYDSDESGLEDNEAGIRLKKDGRNSIKKTRGRNALSILLNQFGSPLIFILIGASILTIFLKEWIDTAVILLAVFTNAALGFYQEYRAENTLQKLVAYIKDRSRVVRGGREMEIDSGDIVRGDILRLSYGSRVPADARIISCRDFSVDESILTGESLPANKNTEVFPAATSLPERANMAYAGTLVVEGYASAVVVATDDRTELGQIARLVSSTKREKTPLQKAMWRVAWIIFAVVAVIVGGIFILGILRGESLFSMLIISAAVASGAVPEALPIALTVILAVGAERIAKRKGVTRNLSAAETLGSTTVVMTDKTGTLTYADMQLTSILPLQELLRAEVKVEIKSFSEKEKEILESALRTLDVIIENSEDEEKEWRFRGRPLEIGIARAASGHGIPIEEILGEKNLQLLPFNSTNKFSVAEDKKSGRVICVGAPDILLAKSDLPRAEQEIILARIGVESEEGHRLIGIAEVKSDDRMRVRSGKIDPKNLSKLEFRGILLFKDPLRAEAIPALKKIESYGARVLMLTGDLKGTAMSVAREIGWNISADSVITGGEMAQMDDKTLSERLPHTRIFARVTPEDKMRVGKLLKAQGEVVAMTGDGVNDAPSLKAVDIGIALGTGSDVAKSAADLVLLDDNFKTIVAAIEEGRRILVNIRKTFVYLMSTALDEIILIGGAIAIGLPLPLTALQIIWVNFFTESFPALSYAFDQNHEKNRFSIKNNREGIFNREVRILTVGIGTLTSLLLLVLYWTLIQVGISVEVARSLLFVCFSSYILAVAFSMRSITKPLFSYPIFENKFLTASVFLGLVFVVSTVTVPFLKEVFDVVTPPLALLWIPVAWIVFNVALVEATKWSFRFFVRQ